MRKFAFSLSSYLATLLALALGCLLTFSLGCNQKGVQEDRTIQYSSDDANQSFQHGDEGVFIVRDGVPEKVFAADEKTLANSTPLWEPDGRRYIFCTAVSSEAPQHAEQHAAQNLSPWDATPEGRVVAGHSIQYTCWLGDETGDQEQEPHKLFDAGLSHLGYVSANLAAKWRPDGQAIFYLETVDDRIQLQYFDFDTKQTSKAFPGSADAMVFEWSPAGDLVLSIIDGKSGALWIRPKGDDNWQQISSNLAGDIRPVIPSQLSFTFGVGNSKSPIEKARAQLPAWSIDGMQFAMVLAKRDKDGIVFERSIVSRTIDSEITLHANPTSPAFDIRWHPNGKTLGWLETSTDGPMPKSKLVLLHSAEATQHKLENPVRFLGWNKTGTHYAATVSSPFPTPEPRWAFLFFPNPVTTESLYVGGVERFSGMRLTFPNWSQKRDEVSCWATLLPRYQSLFSLFLGSGMPAGDPALRIDTQTGQPHWLPVKPLEKAQIGHYYLARGENDKANSFYAEADLLAETEIDPLRNNLNGQLAGIVGYAICSKRLGDEKLSAELFAKFDDMFFPSNSDSTKEETIQPHLQDSNSYSGRLRQAAFLAEVYLALGANDDAIDHFRTLISESNHKHERLSHQVALTQLLLIQENNSDYWELVTNELIPTLHTEWTTKDEEDAAISDLGSSSSIFRTAVSLAMLPCFSAEFLSTLTREELEAGIRRSNTAAESASPTHLPRLATDMLLKTAYEELEMPDLAASAQERINANPQQSLSQIDLKKVIAELQDFPLGRH